MRFEVTFDYLCPFARNAAEAVLDALDDDRDWDVRFRPFSLSEVHVEDGDQSVFEANPAASGLLALQWGVAVRDSMSDRFGAVHRELFAARHDHGRDINDEEVVRSAVRSAGVDPDEVSAVVAGGDPLSTVAAEHREAVDRWRVFGVPTFIHGDEAVFVRFMERGDVPNLQTALGLLSTTGINEFKRTRIPR
jgi:2-hydroxychromene-2-carboxylate isomerase